MENRDEMRDSAFSNRPYFFNSKPIDLNSLEIVVYTWRNPVSIDKNRMIVREFNIIFRNRLIAMGDDLNKSQSNIFIVKSKKLSLESLISTSTFVSFSSCLEQFDLKYSKRISKIKVTFFEKVLNNYLSIITSPEWNLVGNYFMANPFFIYNCSHNWATTLEIMMTNDNKINLRVEGGEVFFPPIPFTYFKIDQDQVFLFENNIIDVIEGNHIKNKNVVTIPTMDKGIITSITRNVLPNTKYRDWQEMQHYWYCSYGLVLNPFHPLIFFNVQFHPSGESYSFTQYCLRRHFPLIIEGIYSKPSVDSFTKDLFGKIQHLCDLNIEFPLRIQTPLFDYTNRQREKRKSDVAKALELASKIKEQNTKKPKIAKKTKNTLKSDVSKALELTSKIKEQNTKKPKITKKTKNTLKSDVAKALE